MSPTAEADSRRRTSRALQIITSAKVSSHALVSARWTPAAAAADSSVLAYESSPASAVRVRYTAPAAAAAPSTTGVTAEITGANDDNDGAARCGRGANVGARCRA